MYKIFLTNFGYFSQREFGSLLEAREGAKKLCFECSIIKDDQVVATFSPLGGFQVVLDGY